MNTIPSIRNTAFESKEHYLAFRQAWKDYVNQGHSLSASWHILYAILRDRDVVKLTAPITNKNKVENGYRSKMFTACQRVCSDCNPKERYKWEITDDNLRTIFSGTVTREKLDKVFPLVRTILDI